MTPREWWRIANAVSDALFAAPGARNSLWLSAAHDVAAHVGTVLYDITANGREPEWAEPDGHVITWKWKPHVDDRYAVACAGDERPFHVYHAHDTWVLVELTSGKFALLCSGTLAQCMAHAERLARAAKGGVKP